MLLSEHGLNTRLIIYIHTYRKFSEGMMGVSVIKMYFTACEHIGHAVLIQVVLSSSLNMGNTPTSER